MRATLETVESVQAEAAKRKWERVPQVEEVTIRIRVGKVGNGRYLGRAPKFRAL